MKKNFIKYFILIGIITFILWTDPACFHRPQPVLPITDTLIVVPPIQWRVLEEEGAMTILGIEIEDCTYLILDGYNGVSITHSGSCKNYIHIN